MQINMTFFLQMLNFGITYWFLNKFMFKPVLAFIKNKKEKEDKIKANLAKKEKALLILEEKKRKDLIDFKSRMKEKYKEESAETPEIPEGVKLKVDKAENKKLISVVKDILVERVPHVD